MGAQVEHDAGATVKLTKLAGSVTPTPNASVICQRRATGRPARMSLTCGAPLTFPENPSKR